MQMQMQMNYRIFQITSGLIVLLLSGCTSFIEVKVSQWHSLPPPNASLSNLPPPNISADSQKPLARFNLPSLLASKVTDLSKAVTLPVFDGQRFTIVNRFNQEGQENTKPENTKSENTKSRLAEFEPRKYSYLIEHELTLLGLTPGEPADFLVNFQVTTPSFVGERLEPHTVPYTSVQCFRNTQGVSQCTPFTAFRTHYYPVRYQYFINTLELSILDATTKGPIWQGKAETIGYEEPNLTFLLPFLTRAALYNFPGTSGLTQTVRFNLDNK